MWKEFNELTNEEKEMINAYANRFNVDKRDIANIYQATGNWEDVIKRYVFNWFYPYEDHQPNYKENILCDMGKIKGFIVLEYNHGLFVDRKDNTVYHLGFDVKRWCHLPDNTEETD